MTSGAAGQGRFDSCARAFQIIQTPGAADRIRPTPWTDMPDSSNRAWRCPSSGAPARLLPSVSPLDDHRTFQQQRRRALKETARSSSCNFTHNHYRFLPPTSPELHQHPPPAMASSSRSSAEMFVVRSARECSHPGCHEHDFLPITVRSTPAALIARLALAACVSRATEVTDSSVSPACCPALHHPLPRHSG